MIIFEYLCEGCGAVFKSCGGFSCLKCGGDQVVRVFEILFKPNKAFCPKEKSVKIDKETAVLLGEFINDDDKKCEGCSCGKKRYSLESFKTHS